MAVPCHHTENATNEPAQVAGVPCPWHTGTAYTCLCPKMFHVIPSFLCMLVSFKMPSVLPKLVSALLQQQEKAFSCNAKRGCLILIITKTESQPAKANCTHAYMSRLMSNFTMLLPGSSCLKMSFCPVPTAPSFSFCPVIFLLHPNVIMRALYRHEERSTKKMGM